MSNTLESLLQRMSLGSITQGWGAVAVFSRERINTLLRQEYINNFGRQRWLPLLQGRHRLADREGALVELQDIQLGTPLLSFQSASLNDARAVVHMDVVAGRYTVRQTGSGSPATLLSSATLTQGQGFWVEMEIDLALVVGEVDRRGRVSIDLSRASSVRCNLADSDEAANLQLAQVFAEQFARLSPERAAFQVGSLNFKRYGPLAPVGFRILTQAAPGARIRGALNYGDGAVVVFIRLRVNVSDGRFPPAADFPYLIPSDLQAGTPYSATFVLAGHLRPLLVGRPLEVLDDLRFPNGHVYEEKARHVPNDLASFGVIAATRDSVSIEPQQAVLRAGQSRQFSLRLGNGEQPAASNWQAVSLEGRTPAAHGGINAGYYTAPAADHLGRETVTVVISADYQVDGQTRRVSSVVRVLHDATSIAPRVAAWAPARVTEPQRLAASTLDASPVQWALHGAVHGELAITSDGQALFSPSPAPAYASVVVQEVEALASERRQANLVLRHGQQLLGVQAAQSRRIRRSAGIQLHDDTSLLPGLPRRWSVIGGGGQVSQSGLFTAPQDGITASSVVLCEVLGGEVVLASGYCVLEMSELLEDESWSDLNQFTIRVKGGLEGETRGSLYANGYQQLEIELLVETRPVNGNPVPLNAWELDSLRLVEDRTEQDVPGIDPEDQGLPESAQAEWGAALLRNRFDQAAPGQLGMPVPRDSNPSVSLVPRYLHSRLGGNSSVTFYAAFQKFADKTWWRSNEHGELHGTVTVTSQPEPTFATDNYRFARKRVDGGSAGPGAPEEDDFDYHLRTVDYWTLSYGAPGVLPVRFETLEFVAEDDSDEINLSMVAWESEALWEEMFSWTGYIFDDPLSTADDSDVVQFDEQLGWLVKGEPQQPGDERNFPIRVNRSFFERGTLVITLHRSDRVAYVRSSGSGYQGAANLARDKLSRDLLVVMRDRQGNLHKRRISFDPPSVVGHRNRLNHVALTSYVDSAGRQGH